MIIDGQTPFWTVTVAVASAAASLQRKQERSSLFFGTSLIASIGKKGDDESVGEIHSVALRTAHALGGGIPFLYKSPLRPTSQPDGGDMLQLHNQMAKLKKHVLNILSSALNIP